MATIDFELDPGHFIVTDQETGTVLAHGIYAMVALRSTTKTESVLTLQLVESRGDPFSPETFDVRLDVRNSSVLGVSLTRHTFYFQQSKVDFRHASV